MRVVCSFFILIMFGCSEMPQGGNIAVESDNTTLRPQGGDTVTQEKVARETVAKETVDPEVQEKPTPVRQTVEVPQKGSPSATPSAIGVRIRLYPLSRSSLYKAAGLARGISEYQWSAAHRAIRSPSTSLTIASAS